MRVIVLGGEGDGAVAASLIEDLADARPAGESLVLLGFLNDAGAGEVLGYPVLGTLASWERWRGEGDVFFLAALHKVKESRRRFALVEGLGIPVERFVSVVHPTAVVSRHARVGRGTVVGPHATLMPGATVGDHCSLRASASVGHDCVVEDFCYLGPNSTLAGRSVMRRGAHLGPNASVLEGRTVGAHAVVGLGTSVLKDVGESDVVFGCPARRIGVAGGGGA